MSFYLENEIIQEKKKINIFKCGNQSFLKIC